MRYVLQTLGTIFAMGLSAWLPQKFGFTVDAEQAEDAVELELQAYNDCREDWRRCDERLEACWEDRIGGDVTLAGYRMGPLLTCDEAALDWLVWVETICPAPRPPEPRGDKLDCRLFHHLSGPTSERLLGRLAESIR